MDTGKLTKLLNDISSARIIVLGDFCLDAYWFVDESTSEISIETGEPTRPVAIQRYTLGGAGNVANNIAAMGVRDIKAFGVIGTDPFGTEMKRIMNDTGIDTSYLLIQENEWSTHTYAKPYIGDHELSRIDFGNSNKLSELTARKMIANLENVLPACDIVIINQQVLSGIHTPFFKNILLETIRNHPEKKFIVDSRKYNDFYDGTIRKMNAAEASRLCGLTAGSEESISVTEASEFAAELYRRFGKPLFVTMGSRGSLIADENGVSEIPGLMIVSRVDTVGAGDSYLAGAASALAAGYNMKDAAVLGTYVAGVTVRKLFQTGTASREEILEAGTDPDLIYSPDLAADIRSARYLPGTEIEKISGKEPEGGILYAIFDNDGTISTLREGWEQIMAPMMMKQILGDKYTGADSALLKEIKKAVDEFIDKTTGVQTLVQMKGLVSLIRDYGFIPENRILDEFGYKKIYNDELLQSVNRRAEKFMKGELNADDLTIKGSLGLVKRLYDKGIKLFLASGTDVEDVRREAALLGYDKYFTGGIFGSVGDINKEAKKIVLDNILDIIGRENGASVITFGDGPVEIRETVKRGGIAVGVASDELKRFGLNINKRGRLIKAGASLLISDFTQTDALCNYLKI
jgi:rfaE bifunctional protein kinase chain/domain